MYYMSNKPSQCSPPHETSLLASPMEWLEKEEFWMGVAASIMAGVFVFLVFEWHK